CLAIVDGDHDRADAAAEPIEKVAWKKLYQYRLALEERWRSGEPTIRPAFPYLGGLVIAIHADYVVMKSKRFFRILKRLDGSYVEIPNANNAGVWCADVDADATVIVTGSLDQAVRLWDAATCKCTLVLEGHRSPVVRVRFIGDYIFSRSSTETRLWNRNSGALLHNFDNATGEFKDWNASAVGIFSLSRDGTVKLWNLETGMCDRILVEGGGPNPVLELAKLHTWGTRFAVESMAPARHFCVYDTQTRALVSTLPPPGSYGYATDPDGAPFVKRLGHGKGFEVWDLESGRKLRDFQVHGELNVAVGRNEICYVDNYRVEWMEMNFGLGIPYSNEF
ncbi:WD40-repeat-containing domain protein, partial [Zopfochytrium polystomum]